MLIKSPRILISNIRFCFIICTLYDPIHIFRWWVSKLIFAHTENDHFQFEGNRGSLMAANSCLLLVLCVQVKDSKFCLCT